MSNLSAKSAPILNKTPTTFLVSMNVCHYPPFARELTHLQDGDSRASYYPVLERWRTTEHVKLSAKQIEEKIKHKLELLEKSFEYEREKLQCMYKNNGAVSYKDN